jgi:hypothetical protein
MISVNISVEFRGYNWGYAAELARWPTWPMEAKIIAKLVPLARELKIGLEVKGFKMEFIVLKL